MTDLPFMRMWWSDYLRDTQHLTTVQHGAYLLLISAYWMRRGPLPEDDRQLAAITRLGLRAFTRERAVLAELFSTGNGAWHHKRIDAELRAASCGAKVRKERAKVAAYARWKDEKEMPQAMLGASPEHAPSMPHACPEECSKNASSEFREEKNASTFEDSGRSGAGDPAPVIPSSAPDHPPREPWKRRKLNRSAAEIRQVEEWCKTVGIEPADPGRLAKIRSLAGGIDPFLACLAAEHRGGNIHRGWDYLQARVTSFGRGWEQVKATAANGGHVADPAHERLVAEVRRKQEAAEARDRARRGVEE